MNWRTRKIVILELGIVSSGIPLVSKQYYAEHGVKDSTILRAGFLSGLNAFVEQTFSDEIESFHMKNFTIVISTSPIAEVNASKLIFYAIGDKKVHLKTAQRALTKVREEFFNKFGKLKKYSGDLSTYSEFEKVIDAILGDLIRKPDERVRSVF